MPVFTFTEMIAYLACVNAVTFIAYGLDKRASMKGGWRISEKSLLSLAFLGGSPAAFLASRVFRHKTKKTSFRSKLILVVILQIILVVGYLAQTH